MEFKREVCTVCTKAVYALERISVEGSVFHKNCLRCAHCSKVLSLGNYAAINGSFYCKPHFSQLFKLKGSYDSIADASVSTPPGTPARGRPVSWHPGAAGAAGRSSSRPLSPAVETITETALEDEDAKPKAAPEASAEEGSTDTAAAAAAAAAAATTVAGSDELEAATALEHLAIAAERLTLDTSAAVVGSVEASAATAPAVLFDIKTKENELDLLKQTLANKERDLEALRSLVAAKTAQLDALRTNQ